MGAAVLLALLQQLQLGTPGVRIGSIDDSAQVLHNVLRVVEDRAGRLLVTQLGAPHIAVFATSDGRFLAQLGHRGGGPGEFVSPGWVGLLGDSIWVADLKLRKYSVFTPTLRHARDIMLGAQTGAAVGRRRAVPFSIAGQGHLVVEASDVGHFHWISIPADGEPVTLHHMREQEAVARFPVGGSRAAVKQPFPDYTIIHAAPDGSAFFLIGRNQRSGIHVTKLRPSGDTVYKKVLPVEAENVTDRVFDLEIEKLVSAAARFDVAGDQIAGEARRALYRPAFSFRISKVEVGTDGTLWIGRTVSDSVSVWHGFDTVAGQPTGRLRLDGGRTLKTGSRSHVWILEQDSLDVQYLVRYPLQRSS